MVLASFLQENMCLRGSQDHKKQIKREREREKGLEEINKPECASFGEN